MCAERNLLHQVLLWYGRRGLENNPKEVFVSYSNSASLLTQCDDKGEFQFISIWCIFPECGYASHDFFTQFTCLLEIMGDMGRRKQLGNPV